ncbi:MAG TPA: FHA domain-containing protein [Pirellulales bacterium]|nr:FHA domain-containing protein [Pirellulales bacterium]
MPLELLLLNEPRSAPLTRFALTEGKFVCGRSTQCDFILLHPSVSRRHAEVAVTVEQIQVSDLDSRNGTFVDGSRVRSALLEVGHTLRLGQASMLLTDQRPPGDGLESAPETTSGRDLDASAATNRALAALSDAQRRVLDLTLDGLAEKQIAKRLSVSQHTVHNHLREIYRAFDVHSRLELVVRLRPGAAQKIDDATIW